MATDGLIVLFSTSNLHDIMYYVMWYKLDVKIIVFSYKLGLNGE